MRVLVCGGRKNTDSAWHFRVLDDLHARTPITAIIEGGQRTYNKDHILVGGSDYFAKCWAVARGVMSEKFAADWTLGPKAGPLRNQRMLDEGKPDLVVTFPGGHGTADMVRRAEAAGIPVHKID